MSKYVIGGVAVYLAIGAGWYVAERARGKGTVLFPLLGWPLYLLFPRGWK